MTAKDTNLPQQFNSLRDWQSWARAGALALLFLVLTLVFTYPLMNHLASSIPGYSGDINYYYWANWWFGKAVESGQNPWHTDMLWHPNGTSLVFSTNRFLSAALGWLIAPLTGPVAAYDIVIILSFLLTAWGMYLLAFDLTGHRVAAFAAAVVFTFNPWKFHKLQNHHFLLSTWAFAFAIYFLLHIVRREKRTVADGVALALLSALLLYESLFYFDFLFLALALFTLWLMIFDRKRVWRAATWKGLGSAALVFIILALPMIIMIVAALPEYGSPPYAPGAEQYSMDLLNILQWSPMPWSPFGGNPADLFTPTNHTYRSGDENFGPIGWIVLPLAVWGWWRGRGRRRAIADGCAFCAVFFVLLSLGPVLYVNGASTGAPMPYSFLSWLPLISLVRAPSRFIIIAFLFIAVLVAFAIADLARRRIAGKSWIAPLAATALIIADYMPHGSALQDQTQYPAAVATVRDLDDDRAVLTFGYSYAENMRYAPIHGKPITSGYVARDTLFGRPVQDFSAGFLHDLVNFARNHPSSPRTARMAETACRIFNAWPIGAVLYNWEPENLPLTARLLGGEATAHEGREALILLPAQHAVQPGLTIDAETFPPMNSANFGSGFLAEQRWGGYNGFRIAIPAALMPERTIELTLSSAIHNPVGGEHEVIVLLNETEIARFAVGGDLETHVITAGGNVRRLPVNLITLLNEYAPAKGDSPFPFSLSVVSGNRFAGNISRVVIGGEELLELTHRSASLIIATLGERNRPRLEGVIELNGAEAASSIAGCLEHAFAQPWIVLAVSGDLSVEAADTLERTAAQHGMKIHARKIRGASYAAVINTRTGEVWDAAERRGLVTLVSGMAPLRDDPTVNIQRITLR